LEEKIRDSGGKKGLSNPRVQEDLFLRGVDLHLYATGTRLKGVSFSVLAEGIVASGRAGLLFTDNRRKKETEKKFSYSSDD